MNKQGKKVMYLGHFNDVKKESEHMTLVLKVYSPRNKGPMIWRCPCVCCEVYAAWMFLLDRINN